MAPGELSPVSKRLSRVPPVAYMALAGMAQRALAPRSAQRLGRARLMLTLVTSVVSAGLATGAVASFLRRATSIDPMCPHKASQLVTSGANGVSRNPMYLGMAGILAAHALARGGISVWLPVVGFIAAIDRGQIAAEEHALNARFGADYRTYRTRTPRWLGPRR